MLMHTLNPAAELDALFNPTAFLNRQTKGFKKESEKIIRPAVDISEDKKTFSIYADLPGVKSDDVKISVEEGILTISGKKVTRNNAIKKNDEGEQNLEYKSHRVERRFGEFNRSFQLPKSANLKQISATFNEGVLTLEIPKKEEDIYQSFEVKISS